MKPSDSFGDAISSMVNDLSRATSKDAVESVWPLLTSHIPEGFPGVTEKSCKAEILKMIDGTDEDHLAGILALTGIVAACARASKIVTHVLMEQTGWTVDQATVALVEMEERLLAESREAEERFSAAPKN